MTTILKAIPWLTYHAYPIAICTVLILGILPRVLRALLSPVRQIPGPFLARFTRLWYFRQVLCGDFDQVNIQLHRRYGPIVRIAPDEYSFEDLQAVKIIYGHGTKFAKAPWYNASGVPSNHPRMNLFTDRDMKNHADNRRKVANLYSMTALLKMEPSVNACIEIILQRFDEFTSSKQSINMHHWLQCYAFDVIGLITFSRRFGFLDKGEDIEEIMKSIHNFLHYSALVGIYNEWHTYLFGLIAIVGFKGMKNIVAFSLDRIKRNSDLDKGEGEMEEDFLSKALALHRAAPDRFSMDDVISTCTSNVGAGSDTTGISLSSILYYLVRNPLTLHKLRVEIEGETQHGTVSSPITFQEAQAMPYLQAVIKESLRLHPATGLPLARVVPAAGAVIAGTRFPGGTIVGVNTWVAHANVSVFGDNARTFRPERWLEGDETTSMLNKFWMPFGVGSRTCIGKNISLLEISKLIPELVRRYDFELIGMDGGLETQNIWFVKSINFFCKIMKREPSGL
ncbi:hypothetical protein VE03_01548 [Pseudogymnoascus sp. 23342-1-I1]|nr:hypothetical protein VE03_01548 [Pseudogymnoascus sp. 23342-1-I1]